MGRRQYIIDALTHEALTDRTKAKLSLNLLMDNGVGVGEHSTKDFWDNCREALDLLVDAEDRLDILDKIKTTDLLN